MCDAYLNVLAVGVVVTCHMNCACSGVCVTYVGSGALGSAFDCHNVLAPAAVTYTYLKDAE
jgi:hypothetical protein